MSQPETPSSRSRKSLGDSAVTMGERIVSQGAQLAIFVIAARVLGPADFGVFALVSACAILLLRASEVGWAPFIMAWKGDETVPRQVLFMACLSGAAVALLGLAGSLVAMALGLSRELVTLTQLFSLWVMLATASSAQKGVLIWQDRLKTSALCETCGELAGLGVASASLLTGWGILSLAFGRLAYQSTHLALSFAFTRMGPLPGMEKGIRDELKTFSWQLFSSRMLVHIRLYVATFLIGGFLGPTAVGYFRSAERLVSAVAELIAVPGQLLAWTLFRKARDGVPEAERHAALEAQVRRYVKGLFAVGTPLFLWLMLMAPELVGGLLGEEWLPAAPLVVLLAFGRLLFLPGVATEPLMSITGEARRLPYYTGTIFVLSIALTVAAAPFGVTAVAWSQVAVSAFALVANGWLCQRYAGIGSLPVATGLSGLILPLGIGAGVLILLDHWGVPAAMPELAQPFAYGIVAVLAYGAGLFAFDRRFVRDFLPR